MRDEEMSTGWPLETRALVVSKLPRRRIAVLVVVGWVVGTWNEALEMISQVMVSYYNLLKIAMRRL